MKKITLSVGKHLRFVERGGWEYVERPGIIGIAVIVAVTARRELILVEQFRPPVRRRVIELPAGLAGDVKGASKEKLLAAAKRELLEETGFTARKWKLLFAGPPSAGVSSEIITFFLATRAEKKGQGGGDTSENIGVHVLPVASIDRWLKQKSKRGLLIDPKVYAGLYFAKVG